MSLWDNVKKFAQPYSDEEYDDYEEELEDFSEEPVEETPRRKRRPSPFTSERSEPRPEPTPVASAPNSGFNGQVLNMGSGKQEVVLFHIKNREDAARATDELRKRKGVIINMENVDQGLARRVVDFLSGSVYALDGGVKKVAQATYLFCPHNMEVVGDLENLNEDAEIKR